MPRAVSRDPLRSRQIGVLLLRMGQEALCFRLVRPSVRDVSTYVRACVLARQHSPTGLTLLLKLTVYFPAVHQCNRSIVLWLLPYRSTRVLNSYHLCPVISGVENQTRPPDSTAHGSYGPQGPVSRGYGGRNKHKVD